MFTNGSRSSRMAVMNSFISGPCEPPWPPSGTPGGTAGREMSGHLLLKFAPRPHPRHAPAFPEHPAGLLHVPRHRGAHQHARDAALAGLEERELVGERVLVGISARLVHGLLAANPRQDTEVNRWPVMPSADAVEWVGYQIGGPPRRQFR